MPIRSYANCRRLGAKRHATLIGFLTAAEVARQQFGENSEVYQNLQREPELFARKAEIVNRYHAQLSQLYAAARAGQISERDALAQKQQAFEELHQACIGHQPRAEIIQPVSGRQQQCRTGL